MTPPTDPPRPSPAAEAAEKYVEDEIASGRRCCTECGRKAEDRQAHVHKAWRAGASWWESQPCRCNNCVGPSWQLAQSAEKGNAKRIAIPKAALSQSSTWHKDWFIHVEGVHGGFDAVKDSPDWLVLSSQSASPPAPQDEGKHWCIGDGCPECVPLQEAPAKNRCASCGRFRLWANLRGQGGENGETWYECVDCLAPADRAPASSSEAFAERAREVVSKLLSVNTYPSWDEHVTYGVGLLSALAQRIRDETLEEAARAAASPDEGYLHGCECRMRIRSLRAAVSPSGRERDK